MFKNKALIAIAIVVFVDLLGYTIILPLLPYYATTFHATPETTGYLVAVYSICQFIASPILGGLSDRYGRRPLLIYSQIGSLVGFVILGLANSLALLFLARIVDGISGGNLTIAQAYIADVTPPKERAGALAIIGIAFGLGFMVGPFIGGTLMENVGYWAPAFLAAFFSLCSTCLSIFYLKEHQHVRDENAKRGLSYYARIFEYLGIRGPVAIGIASTLLLAILIMSAFEINVMIGPLGSTPVVMPLLALLIIGSIYLAFHRPRQEMRILLVVFLYFSLPFALYVSMFSLYAQIMFKFTPQQVGEFLAFVGVLGIIWQGGIIRPLVRRIGELWTTRIGFFALAVGMLGLAFATNWKELAMVAVVYSFGSGVLRPAITSLITQVAPAARKGGALGVTTSLDSLCRSISPIMGGYIIGAIHPNYIGYVGCFLGLVGLVLALTVHTDSHEWPAALRFNSAAVQ